MRGAVSASSTGHHHLVHAVGSSSVSSATICLENISVWFPSAFVQAVVLETAQNMNPKMTGATRNVNTVGA